jgi:hypothetical protein
VEVERQPLKPLFEIAESVAIDRQSRPTTVGRRLNLGAAALADGHRLHRPPGWRFLDGPRELPCTIGSATTARTAQPRKRHHETDGFHQLHEASRFTLR